MNHLSFLKPNAQLKNTSKRIWNKSFQPIRNHVYQNTISEVEICYSLFILFVLFIVS